MMRGIVVTLITKIVLFSLILITGTMAILVAGETKSLALADLSTAPVQAMTTATNGEVLYAGATGGLHAAGIYHSNDRGRTWQVVSPALNGPIAYHFKDGSNQWWTAVQVRNQSPA